LLAAPLRRLASFGPVLLILALPLLMRGLSALISTEKLSLLTARITQALLVLCNLPGYRVVPLGTSPGRLGRDLSYGTIRRFQLQPTGGAPALALLLVPVRDRNSEHPVQMARLPAVLPEFALSQRQLRGLDRADSIAPPLEQLAFGRGPGDPPGAITRLQTCITPGGRSGVTEQTLGRQLNLERGAALFPSPLITKLKRLIGLIPNTRWECLAVQLRAPSPSDPQQLEQVWKLVGSALGRS
jgi:hypothetical protein